MELIVQGLGSSYMPVSMVVLETGSNTGPVATRHEPTRSDCREEFSVSVFLCSLIVSNFAPDTRLSLW